MVRSGLLEERLELIGLLAELGVLVAHLVAQVVLVVPVPKSGMELVVVVNGVLHLQQAVVLGLLVVLEGDEPLENFLKHCAAALLFFLEDLEPLLDLFLADLRCDFVVHEVRKCK